MQLVVLTVVSCNVHDATCQCLTCTAQASIQTLLHGHLVDYIAIFISLYSLCWRQVAHAASHCACSKRGALSALGTNCCILQVAPNSVADVQLYYKPGSYLTREEGTVCISSQTAGSYEYICAGQVS